MISSNNRVERMNRSRNKFKHEEMEDFSRGGKSKKNKQVRGRAQREHQMADCYA